MSKKDRKRKCVCGGGKIEAKIRSKKEGGGDRMVKMKEEHMTKKRSRNTKKKEAMRKKSTV